MTKSQKIRAVLFAIWAEVVFFALMVILVSTGLADTGHPTLSAIAGYVWFFGLGIPGVLAYGFMAHRYKKMSAPT